MCLSRAFSSFPLSPLLHYRTTAEKQMPSLASPVPLASPLSNMVPRSELTFRLCHGQVISGECLTRCICLCCVMVGKTRDGGSCVMMV